ncbi:hypothetical protein [Streptomyces sp. NPDC056512]|uniref:hypothetical protein n=1 Tax=Streptomyces sp. NPDC056512 TaxID=3345846 RepID=UPI0036BD184B
MERTHPSQPDEALRRTGNPIIDEPANSAACADDYAHRDEDGPANPQLGNAIASAQSGQPRTTGGN